MTVPPAIVVTPELKKVVQKIHFSKPTFTPLCIEWKGSFTFTKSFFGNYFI